jgi:hypothetical protein
VSQRTNQLGHRGRNECGAIVHAGIDRFEQLHALEQRQNHVGFDGLRSLGVQVEHRLEQRGDALCECEALLRVRGVSAQLITTWC